MSFIHQRKPLSPARAMQMQAADKQHHSRGHLKGMSYEQGVQMLRPQENEKDGGKPDISSPLQPGTELYVDMGIMGLHHAGVYVAPNQIIHVNGEPDEAIVALLTGKPMVNVERANMDRFVAGRKMSYGPHKTYGERQEAIKRAESKLGAWNYDPLNHNCQHFSSFAATGSAHSPEADKIKQLLAKIARTLGTPARALGKMMKRGAKGLKKGASKAAKGASAVAGWLGKKGKQAWSGVKKLFG